VGEKELPNSSSEMGKSPEEYPIFLDNPPNSLSDSPNSLPELPISAGELGASGREMGNSGRELGELKRETPSFSPGFTSEMGRGLPNPARFDVRDGIRERG